MLPELTQEERTRYERNIMLPEVGEEGQRKLKASSAIIIGIGGLGSISSFYLAAAGIGRIALLDGDVVSLSNLQRQIIHDTQHIRVPKVISAHQRLRALNPDVEVITIQQRLTDENVDTLLSDYTLVIDGCDNHTTRFIINQHCVTKNKTYIYGAVSQFYGQASVFQAQSGPCLRCLFGAELDPTRLDARPVQGVIGSLPAIIAACQVTEAIKLLLGIGEPLVGKMLVFDGLNAEFQKIMIAKDPHCPVCGTTQEEIP